MAVEVEGVQFEVKGSRWRLRECSLRLRGGGGERLRGVV